MATSDDSAMGPGLALGPVLYSDLAETVVEVLNSPEWTRNVVIAAAQALYSMRALDATHHKPGRTLMAGMSILGTAFIDIEDIKDRLAEVTHV